MDEEVPDQDGQAHESVNELFVAVRKEDILQAIEDFEKGVEHEFFPSTKYDLIHEGKPYPPKAILGLACRHLKGGRVLLPSDFSSGANVCFRVLRREGFEIVPKEEEGAIEGGRKYWLYAPGPSAREWDECWNNGYMLLEWDELNDLSTFNSQDDIREALKRAYPENQNPINDTLALWNFVKVMQTGDVVIAKKGTKKYIGYGVVEGEYSYDPQRDEYFHMREVSWKKRGGWDEKLGPIVSKTLTEITSLPTESPHYDTYADRLIDLIGIEEGATPISVTSSNNSPSALLPTSDRQKLEDRTNRLRGLKGRERSTGSMKPQKVTIQTAAYERHASVRADVLDRADGFCELCKKPAPFKKDDGDPFLEVHHVVRLADGGPDIVKNAVAVCPNCHREVHHGVEKDVLTDQLKKFLA